MSEARFLLKEPKSNNKTLIFLIARFNNKRVKYSTGETILPILWDKNAQLAITKKTHEQLKEHNYKLSKNDIVENGSINDQLLRYKEIYTKIFRNLIYNKIDPTTERIKAELDNEFKTFQKQSSSNNLNSYIDQFIKDLESGKRLTDKKSKYKYGSIKNFKGFQVQFDLFQEQKRKVYDFNDITIDFYDDFINYFNEKSYSPNTIGRHIKNLKTIMRISRDENLHQNFEVERKKFKVLKVDTDQIYLSSDEINALFYLDLADKPIELDIARDIFLVGCYTAQRFSDYSRISKDHIKNIQNTKVIELKQQKTGETVIIPIKPELDQILKKYKYELPKIYEQKLNKDIKDVGAEADIKTIINIEEMKGGLTVKKSVPKNELIKTHTARRSGATNMYLAGIPTLDIMKIGGWKTEKQFLKYIRVSKEETAINVSKHSYFNNSLKKAK
jgi:integrase